MTSHSRRGFTLVEVAVAAGMTAVVFLAVATATAAGLAAWRKAEELMGLAREGAEVLRRVEQDLAGAMASPTFPFRGGPTEVSWTTTGVDGPTAVSWKLAASSGDAPVGFTRTWARLLPPRTEPVSGARRYGWISTVAFTYPMGPPSGQAGDPVWGDQWPAEQSARVPQAVRVHVTVTGPRGNSLPLEQTIVLPQGRLGVPASGPS